MRKGGIILSGSLPISAADNGAITWKNGSYTNYSGSAIYHNTLAELEISSSVGINLVGNVNQGSSASGGSLIQTNSVSGTITTGQSKIISGNLNGANYLGLVLEYAIEQGNGGRRFGTIEVIFDQNNATHTDISTPDIGANTKGVVFTTSVSGGTLRLILNNGSGTTLDYAGSIKTIAVP